MTPRILLIDDNPDDLSLIELLLRQVMADAAIVPITSITSFAHCLQEKAAVDAIVAEPDLNWANGREILEAIRRQYPDAVLVLLSDRADADAATRLAGLAHIGRLRKDSTGLLEMPRLLQQCIQRLNEAALGSPIDNDPDPSRLQERLEQLTSAVSHDLREPLQLITQHGQLLKRRYGPQLDDDAKCFLEHIIGSTEHMRRMIDGLLEYFRLGRADPHFNKTDLNLVLQHTREILHGQIEESHAHIEALTLPVVVADERLMVRLFQNLISNAIKFRSKATPVVQVAVEERPAQWLISITDNGIGIRPGDSEQIFGMFQRLHTSEEYPGSGIGLAICQRIAEQHGGTIRVSSKPGGGTRFQVSLSKRLPPTDIDANIPGPSDQGREE